MLRAVDTLVYKFVIKQWRQIFRRDQQRRFTNSVFSRVRAGTNKPVIIVKRGNWISDNGRFHRCKFCGAFTEYGYCKKCRSVSVCAICRRVIQHDRTTLPIHYNEVTDNVSHGFCQKCYKDHYPEEYAKSNYAKKELVYNTI